MDISNGFLHKCTYIHHNEWIRGKKKQVFEWFYLDMDKDEV